MYITDEVKVLHNGPKNPPSEISTVTRNGSNNTQSYVSIM